MSFQRALVDDQRAMMHGVCHAVVLIGLGVVDTLFFVATTFVCDALVGTGPIGGAVVLAYLCGAFVCAGRVSHYFTYYRSALLTRSTALPVPSSDVQALLGATLYSALAVVLAALTPTRLPGYFLVAWAVATAANIAYALTTDDRPTLRRLVYAQVEKRRRRAGDPPAARVTWTGGTRAAGAASDDDDDDDDDSWSSVSLDGRTDVTEQLFDDMDESRRQDVVDAIKRQ